MNRDIQSHYQEATGTNIARRSLPIIAALIFLSFPVALGLANTLLAVLLIAWLAGGDYRAHWHAIRNNPVILSALILYGVIIVGILYSPAPSQDILLHLNKYSKLPLAAVLFCAIGEPVWQRRCLAAFAAAMLLVLASTWLNIWFLLPWSASQNLGWGSSHHVFGDYITQNVMMSFFVLLCLVWAHEETSPAKRISWLIVALLGGISITHLSQGRTGYVLVSVSLLVYVFSQLKGKTRWIALVLAVISFGVAVSSSQLIKQRLTQAVTEMEQSDVDNHTSIGHRLYNYKTTIALIQDQPFLGAGTGAYHTAVCEYIEKQEECERFNWHPHNQFLFFGADHGAIGVFAYLLLILSMIYLGARTKNSATCTLLVGLAALLFINSLFNSSFWSARESHFFIFMMALLAAQSSLNQKQNICLPSYKG